MNFIEAKAIYKQAREEERRKLIDVLNHHEYKATYRGGRGRKDYTSGSKMKPYDLSNFMYIEATKGNTNYFISLQPFDTDPNSFNRHFLPDRIGLCKYTGRYDPDYIYTNITVLNIDLPLSDSDYAILLAEMEKQ